MGGGVAGTTGQGDRHQGRVTSIRGEGHRYRGGGGTGTGVEGRRYQG